MKNACRASTLSHRQFDLIDLKMLRSRSQHLVSLASPVLGARR